MNQLTLCPTNWDRDTMADGESFERSEVRRDTDSSDEIGSTGNNTTQSTSVRPRTPDNTKNSMRTVIRNAPPTELATQDELIRANSATAQPCMSFVLFEHFREVQAEVNRRLQETQDNAATAHEAIRALQLAFRELEKNVPERDHEQKAQAEQRRLEREVVELRESLRNEKEARMWDAIRAQELAAQDSRKLMEAMARGNERDANPQQKQDDAECDVELRIHRAQEESVVDVEQIWDAIRAQESVIQQLEKKVEDQTRVHMAQLEHQRVGYEPAEHNVAGLREILDGARYARAEDETLRNEMEVGVRDQAHVQELRRLIGVMAREHHERDVRLQQERDDSAREMEWRIQQAHEETAVSLAQMQEVMCAQESTIQELEKKIENQTHTQRAQAEHQRAEYEQTERRIVELREDLDNERDARARDEWLHDEKEEETRDQVLLQELECQELRSLMEVMAREQRESIARVQQERHEAARGIERRLRIVQADIADNEVRVQELASKVQENTRTQADHLRLEREKTEHEMVELRQVLHDERTVRLQEAAHAQVLATQELNRREEAIVLAQRERDARLDQEHRKFTLEIEGQLQNVRADIVGNGVHVQEALRVQELVIKELRSQTEDMVKEQELGDQPLRNAFKEFQVYSRGTYSYSRIDRNTENI